MRTILLLFALIHSGCAHQPVQTEPIEDVPPLLYLLINDVSGSAKHLVYASAVMSTLLARDTLRPAIQVAGVRTLANSYLQTPYVSQLLKPSLQLVDGTIYERQETETLNERLRSIYRDSCQSVVRDLSEYLNLPRDEKHTDITGALFLAAQMANQPNFKDYEIRLIILSDMIQDLPRPRKVEPIEFPVNTRIFIVGKSPGVDIESLIKKDGIIYLSAFNADFFTDKF
jgi:hypothetical protein